LVFSLSLDSNFSASHTHTEGHTKKGGERKNADEQGQNHLSELFAFPNKSKKENEQSYPKKNKIATGP